MEENSKNNTGCAIAIGIFILSNIICFFATSSNSDIANLGVFLTSVIFLVAAYFGIKAYLRRTENSSSNIVRIGIPIVIFVVLMLIMGLVIKDFTTMLALGGILFVIFCIVIGIMMYNSYKD